MIKIKLKIILVEDNHADKVLIERQIKKTVIDPNILHVSDLDTLKEQIDLFKPDLILSDYALNGFNGFDVLKYSNELDTKIPLIFITGTINDEEIAASTILTGAKGYILKKNINTLHEKLEPYLGEIINDKKMEVITSDHKKVFNEMEDYLATVKLENEMIVSSYKEIKRALEIMKSTLKSKKE